MAFATGRIVKKLILTVQIFVFAWTSIVSAADGQSSNQAAISNQTTETILTQMPKNYKLPDMQLLDSVAFYNRYKDKQGHRVSVQGYNGRFGATFGEEFKKQIFEIERMNEQKVEIILTLTSTMADAKVLRDRMALVGRKMIIVEIPDEIQQRILGRAEAEAAGGLKELWWDTKSVGSKLIHPQKTLSDVKKILKNQIVKPSHNDVRLTAVSIGSTVVTTALLLSVGVDPAFALTMAAARIAIGGPTTYFRYTIRNLFSSDLTDETRVTSTARQVFTRLLVLGLGISEAYYGIGSSFSSPDFKLTQGQLISNSVASGLIDTAASIEKTKRLSPNANYRMTLYTLMIGSIISAFYAVGKVGPMVLEYGVFQISTLQASSMVVFSGFYLSYKFLSMHVEKIAQRDLLQSAKEKYQRLANLRTARVQRILKEQEAILFNRRALDAALYDIRVKKGLIHPTCSNLFL